MLNYYNQSQKQTKTKQPNIAQILYIGELPRDVDQYELDQYIHSLGKFDIESLTVKPTKENKAFAYVKFKNKVQAEEALKKLNLSILKNHIIRAEPFKSVDKTDLPKDDSTNLFIKNLPNDSTPKDLYDLFIKYGNIVSIKLKQKENNECLGYGYVKFEKFEDAQKAIEQLNESNYKGKKILVSNFFSKKKRNEEDKFPLVLIRNISQNLQNGNNLKEFLEKYGQINFCSIINSTQNKNEFNKETHEMSHPSEIEKIGLAVFENKEQANLAIRELNGKIIDSDLKPFYISLAPINKDILEKLSRAKKENFKARYEGCNLVVKNLPKEIDDKNLFEIFKVFGDIKTARIATEGLMKDKLDDKGNVIDKEFVYESKGFGYVLYKNPLDAAKAMESMNNKIIDFKNLKIKTLVEYYDYSKENNSNIQDLIVQSGKPKKSFNQEQNNQNYSSGGKYQNKKFMNQNNQSNQYNKFQQGQISGYSNQSQESMSQGNYKGNFRGYGSNQGQMFNNQNINNFNSNYRMNQNNMNQRVTPFNNQNPQYSKPQSMNLNMNILPNHAGQQQKTQSGNIIIPKNENSEFIINIENILRQPHSEERTENLGEKIFYFLLEFIPKYNLNLTQGEFDDTILCSKLTGILIHEDDEYIYETVSKSENLFSFIRSVVIKLIQSKNESK